MLQAAGATDGWSGSATCAHDAMLDIFMRLGHIVNISDEQHFQRKTPLYMQNLSFSGNSEPSSAGSSFVACGACCVTVVAALLAVPLASVRLLRALTTSSSSSDGAGAHRPAFLFPP